jgi:hypothetical protein
MKRLVNFVNVTQVTVGMLMSGEIIAYRCKSEKVSHAVLAAIKTPRTHGEETYDKVYGSGFVPLNNSNSNVRYFCTDWNGAIQTALKAGKELYVFDSEKELCTAIVDGVF